MNKKKNQTLKFSLFTFVKETKGAKKETERRKTNRIEDKAKEKKTEENVSKAYGYRVQFSSQCAVHCESVVGRSI